MHWQRATSRSRGFTVRSRTTATNFIIKYSHFAFTAINERLDGSIEFHSDVYANARRAQMQRKWNCVASRDSRLDNTALRAVCKWYARQAIGNVRRIRWTERRDEARVRHDNSSSRTNTTIHTIVVHIGKLRLCSCSEYLCVALFDSGNMGRACVYLCVVCFAHTSTRAQHTLAMVSCRTTQITRV